jgi:hypothetical protein
MRTGFCRTAIDITIIRNRPDDERWYCGAVTHMMTFDARLHCANTTLIAVQAPAWDGHDYLSLGVHLSNPRPERRLLQFLELSGVRQTVDAELDVDAWDAASMGFGSATGEGSTSCTLPCIVAFSATVHC